MGSIRKLFMFFLALGLVCLACYTVPYVVFASVMVESMPFGKEQGEAWLLGTPQPVYEGGIPSNGGSASAGYGDPGYVPSCKKGGPLGCASAYPIWDGEQVPYAGYVMAPDFTCKKLVDFGYLSDVFGSERHGCGADGTAPCKRHSGVDFATNGKPAPVYTPIGGLVTWADWDPQWYFGQFVAIESNGYQVIFAHLSRIDVVKLQVVHAGDQIGMTGTTGNSEGIHLHFEVRYWDGKRWVPIDLLDPSFRFPGQLDYCPWRTLPPKK